MFILFYEVAAWVYNMIDINTRGAGSEWAFPEERRT